MLQLSPIMYFVGAVAAALVVVFTMGYVKASPNEAIIISGLRKKPKALIGKAGVLIPFIERRDKLHLALVAISVETSSAVPTADYININVDANVNVQIGTDTESLEKAAKNFLNKNEGYISKIAMEVLEGNMREIVGRMRLEEMVSDRQKFEELVRENAAPDLAGMGLNIISFNVQNFIDENDVIANLGIDNIVKIKKAAAIARAESERDIKVAQAAADKESNDAAVNSQTEIVKKQNELAIKKSELQMEADTKKAMADAAYQIQQEEQRKRIEVARVNADIARQEREAELKAREAEVREKALDAEVRKVADADRYRIQQEAEADKYRIQQDAEARMYRAQKDAEASKAEADAERYAQEQEAIGKEAMGKAEAAAIQAKGMAEATAMEKKADAYGKYNGAAIMQMIVEKLPQIAHEVAAPLENIGNITIVDSGNGASGVDSVGSYTPAVLRQVMESVKATTGFDLLDVMKANTYAAKTDRNITVNGDGVEVQAAVGLVKDNTGITEAGM